MNWSPPGAAPPACSLWVTRSRGIPTSLAFFPKEDGEAHCCTEFLLAIPDISQQEAQFPPIEMKLKVAMSCGNELILHNISGCLGRDVDSSCFRGGTLDSRRRSKIDICFSVKAGFFAINQSPAPFCTSIKMPLLPLSVWKYASHGNPMKTFRKSEKPVLSASWQRYTAPGCYQIVVRSIRQRIFSFAYPDNETMLCVGLNALWIFFLSGAQHRCTKVTSYLGMSSFDRILPVPRATHFYNEQ